MGGRTSSGIALEVEDITHVYRAGLPGTTKALDDVSYGIPEEGFTLLLGPSGCGKSTMLNIVAGFLNPTDGKVLEYGEPIKGPDKSRGVIFQSPNLFPWSSIWDNVMFGPRLSGEPSEETKERARHFFEMVGLDGFEDSKPHELSGGMKSRAAVLRTLINDPDIILADEPYASLDAHTRRDLQAEFERLWEEEEKTVLWITHQIEEAVYLADEIIVLTARPGKVKRRIKIEIERPRERLSEEFVEYEQQIRDLLTPEL